MGNTAGSWEAKKKIVTTKAPRALYPAVVVPPLGCKIYHGHPRYKP